MSRGAIRPTTPAEAAERARSMLSRPLEPVNGRGPAQPLAYRLRNYNGGKDPYADQPGTWARDWGRWCCDCVGLATWSLGFDRYQPDDFTEAGSYRYINTDSMLIAAAAPEPTWFVESEVPELGGLAVYGSVHEGGRRTRVGHVAVVVEVPAEFDPGFLECWSAVKVVHCSSSAFKRTGDAIVETDAHLWRRREGKWLRYLRAT